MTTSLSRRDAAALMGAALDEIEGTLEHEHGCVVRMMDGHAYLVADVPDAEGKTGLMHLSVPTVDGKPIVTSFPVFAPIPVLDDEPAADDADDGDSGDGLDGLTKDELIAYAAERQITLDKRNGRDKLLAELRQALADLAALDESDDTDGGAA